MTLRFNLKRIEERFLLLVTAFMFISFYIFSTYTWGRYLLALAAILVFGIGVVLHNDYSYKIKLNMFHIIQILFSVYCLLSCIWSIDNTLTLEKSMTLFQIVFFFSLLACYFIKLDSAAPLFDVIMWSGYIVSIYTFVYYGGINSITDMLIRSSRLSNDFANSNSIGMLCAIACIIQVYKIIYEKKAWSSFFMIPTIMILAVCQSRKSIIALVLGLIAMIILMNAKKKNWIVSLFKIIVSLVVFYFILKMLLSLEIFTGLTKRLDLLFQTLISPESVDAETSAATRLNFINIGFDYFSQKPILGYGFSTSNIILSREAMQNTYFHNNYIELLFCGGIIGLFLYYANYVYLLYSLVKYRKFSQKENDLCIIILIIMLIMDLGCVTYSNKNQYFYFMTFYINLEIIKRERNRLTLDVKEDTMQAS